MSENNKNEYHNFQKPNVKSNFFLPTTNPKPNSVSQTAKKDSKSSQLKRLELGNVCHFCMKIRPG